MQMKCSKFSTGSELQGSDSSVAKHFFVRLDWHASVSSAFAATQLGMCMLQFITELSDRFWHTAVAFLWLLENIDRKIISLQLFVPSYKKLHFEIPITPDALCQKIRLLFSTLP